MSETTADYVIARGDDWEGLYINGRLVTEGHSLKIEDILKEAQKQPPTNSAVRWVDIDWLQERGDLPKAIAKVVWAE